MVALCPIEHDLAYSEETGKDFIQIRQEAEAEALEANPKMSLLTTDLVFGEDPQYIFHYMAQSGLDGSIMPGFHSEDAIFRPIHKSDVIKAVSHQLSADGTPGHFSLHGGNEHSIKQILSLVE